MERCGALLLAHDHDTRGKRLGETHKAQPLRARVNQRCVSVRVGVVLRVGQEAIACKQERLHDERDFWRAGPRA